MDYLGAFVGNIDFTVSVRWRLSTLVTHVSEGQVIFRRVLVPQYETMLIYDALHVVDWI
jgi:hypothetical protein